MLFLENFSFHYTLVGYYSARIFLNLTNFYEEKFTGSLRYTKMNFIKPKLKPDLPNRHDFPDILRGFAVILMFIFHCSYDLNLLGFIEINIHKYTLWYVLPRIIVFLFLFCVGLTITLTHKNGIKWGKFHRRLGKITVCAIGVSLATYLCFPKHWIYFGTLHCIAVCSLLALPLLKHHFLALIGAIALFIPALLGKTIPWFLLSHNSMDYIPPFPWFGVVLLGIFSNGINIHRISIPKWRILVPAKNTLVFLGRHSLPIYLIHQPVIYGVLKLIQMTVSR